MYTALVYQVEANTSYIVCRLSLGWECLKETVSKHPLGSQQQLHPHNAQICPLYHLTHCYRFKEAPLFWQVPGVAWVGVWYCGSLLAFSCVEAKTGTLRYWKTSAKPPSAWPLFQQHELEQRETLKWKRLFRICNAARKTMKWESAPFYSDEARKVQLQNTHTHTHTVLYMILWIFIRLQIP